MNQRAAWGVQSRPGSGDRPNADSCFTPEQLELTRQPAQAAELVERCGALFAVADGLHGGALDGEAGSHLLQMLADAYYQLPWPDREAALRRAATIAHDYLYTRTRSGLGGVGAALVAAVVQGRRVILAHVGDCRAYLWRQGALTRLTSDHVYGEQLATEGGLRPEQIASHPYRETLTRALGRTAEVEVEVQPLPHPAGRGDVLLLCTDGLTDVVPETEIAGLLAAEEPQRAAGRLVSRAQELGGRDDATAIVIPLPLRRPAPSSARLDLWTLLALVVVVIGLAVCAGLLVLTTLGELDAPRGAAESPAATAGGAASGATRGPKQAGGSPAVAHAGPTPDAPVSSPAAAPTSTGPRSAAGELIASGGTHGGEWRLTRARCRRVTVFYVDGPERARRMPYYELRHVRDENGLFVYSLLVEAVAAGTAGDPVQCLGELSPGSIALQARTGAGLLWQVMRPRAVTTVTVDFNPPADEPSAPPLWRLILP